MREQKKVTGVVLAGGLARRMNQVDKGLVLYHGKAMVSYALNAMEAIADQVLINANRNVADYKRFGYNVVSDESNTFDGPLAGVLAAMSCCDTALLLVMPCDSPLIKAEHLQQLLDTLEHEDAEIAVAYDGVRIQPVFFAIKTALQDSLKHYLQQGGRKIDLWLQQHHLVNVDFSQQSDVFLNINTLSELETLEKGADERS